MNINRKKGRLFMLSMRTGLDLGENNWEFAGLATRLHERFLPLFRQPFSADLLRGGSGNKKSN